MILALDIATTTGWCVGAGDRDPVIGHVALPVGHDGVRGPKFSAFRAWLLKILSDWQPEVVIFEAPILPKPFFDKKSRKWIWPTSIEVTTVLQGLAAIVELECHDRGIFICQAEPSEVKKELTGNGKADKPVMVRVAERVLGRKMAVHDEADAFGVWLIGLRHYAPQFRPEWDKRIWGRGRGGLL
jgi:Holliday junction resolvasome RuvABC endonuclease subunit